MFKFFFFSHFRSLVSNLRRLEKEAYAIHKLLLENPEKEDYATRLCYCEELDNLDEKVI